MNRIIKLSIHSIEPRKTYIINRMLKPKEHLTERERERQTLRLVMKCFNDNYSITTVYSGFADITLQAGEKNPAQMSNHGARMILNFLKTYFEKETEFSPISPTPCPKGENVKLCISLVIF